MSWTWNHRLFGTLHDPVRKSALNNIATQNGCGKRYSLERNALDSPTHCHWKPTLGTAIHETIRRCFVPTAWPQFVEVWRRVQTDRRAAVKAAPEGLRANVKRALVEELERATAGRELRWYDDSPDEELEAAVAMVLGALRSASERVEEVVGTELPFMVKVGDYYGAGTLDLVYRDAAGAIAIADWKSGARKEDPITLDHGYQAALYAEALRSGVVWFGLKWESEEDAAHMRTRMVRIEEGAELAATERRFGEWPAHIEVVHLRDFTPYKKAPAKKTGKTIDSERGPGWYPSNRSPSDVVRLHVSLSSIVGTVRLGRFVERVGEQCRRCRFREQCLGEAPALSSEAQRQIRAAGIDDDGLGAESND